MDNDKNNMLSRLDQLVKEDSKFDAFKAKVKDLGFRVRIREKNGESLAGTCDYVPSRINVSVEEKDGSMNVLKVIGLG
jgi:hypothetical protein